MARKDLSTADASDREGRTLNTLLSQTKSAQRPKIKLLSVEQALQQKRIATKPAKRSAVRVLFISQDTTLLNPGTQSLDGYLQLKDLFEEVHILILRTGIAAKYPVLRVEDNVWLYTASAKAWWNMHRVGTDLLEQELVFAQGFRPDLIVARDPFESSLVGKRLAAKYHKPLQIHVLKNYTTDEFRHEAAKNVWRRFMPRFTIPAATSVRADTEEIETLIKQKFRVPDVSVLPKFQSYDAIMEATPVFSLTEKYKPLIFFFLFIGKLDESSTAYKAMDALRNVLQNPRVGFIILGDGPAKSEFEKRAKLLGIEKQVIFESKVTDIISYLKGAHVAIVSDKGGVADEFLLQAAAAQLPAVMTVTEKRTDLFEHTVSGWLCEEDPSAISEGVSYLLNNAGQRTLMGEYAAQMIKQRFHNSAKEYQDAFRDSIEETIFVDGTEANQD